MTKMRLDSTAGGNRKNAPVSDMIHNRGLSIPRREQTPDNAAKQSRANDSDQNRSKSNALDRPSQDVLISEISSVRFLTVRQPRSFTAVETEATLWEAPDSGELTSLIRRDATAGSASTVAVIRSSVVVSSSNQAQQCQGGDTRRRQLASVFIVTYAAFFMGQRAGTLAVARRHRSASVLNLSRRTSRSSFALALCSIALADSVMEGKPYPPAEPVS